MGVNRGNVNLLLPRASFVCVRGHVYVYVYVSVHAGVRKRMCKCALGG